jgi:hypothetical protein
MKTTSSRLQIKYASCVLRLFRALEDVLILGAYHARFTYVKDGENKEVLYATLFCKNCLTHGQL